MKFRIMGLALSLCLVLSSCGGQDGGGQASLLAQAAGWDDTQTLLVIGGREVPGWRYLYWLAGACDQVQEEYTLSGAELTGRLPLEPEPWLTRSRTRPCGTRHCIPRWNCGRSNMGIL